MEAILGGHNNTTEWAHESIMNTDQKGTENNSRRPGDQARKSDLRSAWIDYKKSCDSMPHTLYKDSRVARTSFLYMNNTSVLKSTVGH